MTTRLTRNYVRELITELDILNRIPEPDPDEFNDRFSQFNLRKPEPRPDLETAGDMFPDTDAPRPSAHRKDADRLDPRLKKEIDRLRKKRVDAMKKFETYKDILGGYGDSKIDSAEKMGIAMDKLRKQDDVMKKLQQNLKKAQSSYDDKIIKPAEELGKPKAPSSPDIDEYTPEQRARLDAERKRIDKAVDTFQTTMSDAAKVADKPPVPYWKTIASRAGSLARKLGKSLPVIGTGVSAYEAGTIGKSMYDAATDPDLSGSEKLKSAMDSIRSNTLSGAAAGAMADMDTETQFTGPDGNPVDHSRMTPSELSAHNFRVFKRMGGM